MKHITTPQNITALNENEIFVFGSNRNGNHTGGAAKLAKDSFGAKEGVGEGPTGQCYAFPTLDENMVPVSLNDITRSKETLYEYARSNPDKHFLVTKVGCGIAGFSEEDMKQVFCGEKPENIALPVGWAPIRGFKAFEENLICRGMQYELGKDFIHDGEISPCKSGLHFCKTVGGVYDYYLFGSVVAEVEAFGDVVTDDDEKLVTNGLRLIRILNAETEARANTGKSNSGYQNSGHQNSGDRNSGNRNSGHQNSGYQNSGDWNSGNWNSGNRNSGHLNSGYQNSGDWNSGGRNSGNQNSGYWNSGDRNSGYQNSGDRNSGDQNSGYQNSGDRNSGYQNSGGRNSGNRNSGDWNSGDWNSGYFNDDTEDIIRVFGAPLKRSDWEKVGKPSWVYFDLVKWIDFNEMTDDEKNSNPSAKTTGGYLKTLGYKEAWKEAYDSATPEERIKIKNLPNWNADKFFNITGIRID